MRCFRIVVAVAAVAAVSATAATADTLTVRAWNVRSICTV